VIVLQKSWLIDTKLKHDYREKINNDEGRVIWNCCREFNI